MRRANRFVFAALLAALLTPTGAADAQSGFSLPGAVSRPSAGLQAQSQWVKGHNSMVRLVAGALPPRGKAKDTEVLAGVEIRLADGWKTYWRYPGDDGGLPPSFDWTGSTNLKSATVLYPVPERQKSLNGTTLGYSKAVIFPVRIEAIDPAKPVSVSLAMEYGICREICIPAEAKMSLVIDPSLATMPMELAASLARVPQPVEGPAAAQILKSAKANLSGPARSLTFDISSGAAGSPVDLFVEAPGGAFMPVPAKVGEPSGGVQRFKIDLKAVEEAAQLAGKPLRLTVTGGSGSHELTWIVK